MNGINGVPQGTCPRDCSSCSPLVGLVALYQYNGCVWHWEQRPVLRRLFCSLNCILKICMFATTSRKNWHTHTHLWSRIGGQ